MATEKDSEQLLKPYFDSNRRKVLYEWLSEFLAGQETTFRGLTDVDLNGDARGTVFYNQPDTDDGIVQAEFPDQPFEITTTSTTISPLLGGPHYFYYTTASDCAVTLDPSPYDDPVVFTIYNATAGGTTITEGLGVTITFPTGVSAVTGTYVLRTPGQYLTLRRIAQNQYIAIGQHELKYLMDVDMASNEWGQVLYNFPPQGDGLFSADHPHKLIPVSAGGNLNIGQGNQPVFYATGASFTLTIDPDDVDLPNTHSTFIVLNDTTGTITFAPGAGVTFVKKAGFDAETSIRGGKVEFRHVAANKWFIHGDLDAS